MLFNVELVYGGVFRIEGFPQEHMLPLLFIECPRLLFPFARQIIAEATRNGGFPPLMLDPIDFAQMFQQKLAEDQAAAKVAGQLEREPASAPSEPHALGGSAIFSQIALSPSSPTSRGMRGALRVASGAAAAAPAAAGRLISTSIASSIVADGLRRRCRGPSAACLPPISSI